MLEVLWLTTSGIVDEVHYDDALWAYTICAFEEWKNRDVTRWNDPIIDRLFLMGCPDWTGVDNH